MPAHECRSYAVAAFALMHSWRRPPWDCADHPTDNVRHDLRVRPPKPTDVAARAPPAVPPHRFCRRRRQPVHARAGESGTTACSSSSHLFAAGRYRTGICHQHKREQASAHSCLLQHPWSRFTRFTRCTSTQQPGMPHMGTSTKQQPAEFQSFDLTCQV